MGNKKSEIQAGTRLGLILLKLHEADSIGAQSLAKSSNMSIRSIYRDVKLLQKHGYKIIGSTGHEGGYIWQNKLELSDELSESQKRTAIEMDLRFRTSKSLINTHSNNDKSFLRKLGNSFDHIKDKVFFDTTDWYWENKLDNVMLHLTDAISNQRAVKIKYTERNNDNIFHAIALPYGIVWKGGNWYLVTLINSKIIRIRTTRIKELEYIDKKFEYPENFNLENWWREELLSFGSGNTEVILKAYDDAIPELMEISAKQDTVKKLENGVLTIKLYVDNYDWIIPIILTYGGKVYPDAPIDLQKKIAGIVFKMGHQYLQFTNELIDEHEDYINNDSRQRISRKTKE